MRLLLIFIFSILICYSSYAQEEAALDTLTNIPDTVTTIENRPFSIGVYADYGKLFTYWTDFESKLEFGAIAQYNSWGAGFEYGTAELTPFRPYRNGDASVEGSYMGGYLQYYVRIDNKNDLFAGFGYYTANFDDEVVFEIESDLWGKHEEIITRKDLNASWWAIRIGSEQKLTRVIYLGGVFEFRIKKHLDETERLMPYAIPGYGKSRNTTTPALNLYLAFKL